MPSGGNEFYYFSEYIVIWDDEKGYFHIQVNRETVCTAFAQQTDTPANDGPTSCVAVSFVGEGMD